MRLARVGLHIAQGVATAACVFPFAGNPRRRVHVQRWSIALLDILGVRLHVHGTRPTMADVPLMVVANHISWLDIMAINAVLPVRFVAKSEVRSWPLVGWLCAKVGTLFIERGQRRAAAHVSAQLVRLMREGTPVAVFPEGTTTDGSEVRGFHSSLLQPAVLAGARVWPVALRYVRADGTPCREAAFTGEMSLWESLHLVTAKRRIRAELLFLPALEGRTPHRRELARAARASILQSLSLPAPHSPAGTAGGPRAAGH